MLKKDFCGLVMLPEKCKILNLMKSDKMQYIIYSEI